MIITFDIETIPTADIKVINGLRSSIKPPAQYKKQDSIEKWMHENAKEELEKVVSKTSLNGLYGNAACIAWCADEGEIFSSEKEMSEVEAINSFYQYIALFNSATIIFCGHNIAGFDLPFLKHRSIILGIKPPECLINAMNSKPWGGHVLDTMHMWSSDKDKRVSMSELCAALGIEGKGDIDGSMVAELWFKDPEKVIDYCKEDVFRTREIYKRLSFQTAVNQ